MGTPSDHDARAAENEGLAGDLASKGNFRWASVLVFYAALHHVSATLAELNGVATDALTHMTTQYKIDQLHPAIYSRYLALYGESRRCRYIAHHEADADSYRRQQQHLKAIRDYCERARSGSIRGI
jgi:hypothetical protein